jgi:predicted kinase
MLKKELLARGLPIPGVLGTKPGEPELKLPSDAEVDKVISFLEKVWRRLIEMGRSVLKDAEEKLRAFRRLHHLRVAYDSARVSA